MYVLPNTLVGDIGAADLQTLASDPDVVHISLDMSVSAAADGDPISDGATASQVLRATLGVSPRDPGGRGVGIAVIDSGIQPMAGLTPVASFDFTRDGQQVAASDEYGHGTHVAGLIAAGATAGDQMQGLAPLARLVSLRVLDAEGRGLTSAAIQALDFAVANRRRLGIDIVNLSLGHPITEAASDDPLVAAVEAATRAGLVVVVAAGNRGRGSADAPVYGGILSPANAPSAIAVGALDTRATVTRGDDAVAAYSSRGPTRFDHQVKPDLVAPGHNLISAGAADSLLYRRYVDRQVDGGANRRYLRLSGTSMAAAVTSGVAALLIATERAAGAAEMSSTAIKAMLQFTATGVPGEDHLTEGAGALNARGALDLLTARLTRRGAPYHPTTLDNAPL
jgi:serine protease AprX